MEKILNEAIKEKRKELFSVKEIETKLPYIKPAIVIGLGGSGTKAIARLKKRMETWAESYATTYSQIRKQEGIPEEELQQTVARALKNIVGYLAIDTLSFPNLEQEDQVIAETLGGNDYLYAGGFNPVDYISSQYIGDENLQRWWENDFYPPYTYIDDGARRFRMLGRLALYRIREEFRDRLVGKVGQVVELRKDLVNLGLVHSHTGELNEILIYLVTGSNGGTGSGMFFDALFHAFSAVRSVGDILPKVRIVVVSPRIYLLMSSQSGSGLNDALTANAYAFFQSLSFIVEKPKEAIQYVFDFHTNSILQTQANDLNERWRPDKVYIIDTAIAGKEIGDLNGMLTNAADYLFLDITQPVTIGGAQVVNLEQVLEERFKGHRRILASFGVSYLIMPSITIIKGLTLLLLNDLLEYISKEEKVSQQEISASQDPRSEQLIQEGKKEAESFVKNYVESENENREQLESWFLKPEVNSKIIKSLINIWEDEQKSTSDSSKVGYMISEIEEKLQKANDNLKRQKRGLYIRESIFSSIGAVILIVVGWMFATETELMPPLLAGFCGAILGGGLGFLAFYLSGKSFRDQLAATKHEGQQLEERKSRFNNAIGQVKKILEDKKVAEEKQRSEIGEHVKRLAGQLKEYVSTYMQNNLFRFEADEITSKYTTIYCWGFEEDENEDLKPIFGEPTKQTGEQILKMIFLSPEDQKGICGGDTSLNINYQFNKNTLFYREVIKELAGFKSTKDKLTGDERDNLLKTLSEKLVNSVVHAYSVRFGYRVKEDLSLWDGLSTFDKTNIQKMEKYFNNVGEQLRTLSEPTWGYDVADSPRTKKISAIHLIPKGLKDAFGDVWGNGYPLNDVLYDKRMAITVQSEYGIPIFALRGIQQWKKKYENWMGEWRARGEAPPHVDKRWLVGDSGGQTINVLPVLEPNVDDKITESYLRFLLMGNFVEEFRSHNNVDLKKLQNTRGETFEAFWNKIVKTLEIEKEQTTIDEKEKLSETELNEFSNRIFLTLRTYFDRFKKHVMANNKENLGEIAALWDKFQELDGFKSFHDRKKMSLTRLYEIIKGTRIPSKDELEELFKDLGSVFRVKTIDQVAYKDDDKSFLLNLALALSRL